MIQFYRLTGSNRCHWLAVPTHSASHWSTTTVTDPFSDWWAVHTEETSNWLLADQLSSSSPRELTLSCTNSSPLHHAFISSICVLVVFNSIHYFNSSISKFVKLFLNVNFHYLFYQLIHIWFVNISNT